LRSSAGSVRRALAELDVEHQRSRELAELAAQSVTVEGCRHQQVRSDLEARLARTVAPK
jgi:hypothetical protein